MKLQKKRFLIFGILVSLIIIIIFTLQAANKQKNYISEFQALLNDVPSQGSNIIKPKLNTNSYVKDIIIVATSELDIDPGWSYWRETYNITYKLDNAFDHLQSVEQYNILMELINENSKNVYTAISEAFPKHTKYQISSYSNLEETPESKSLYKEYGDWPIYSSQVNIICETQNNTYDNPNVLKESFSKNGKEIFSNKDNIFAKASKKNNSTTSPKEEDKNTCSVCGKVASTAYNSFTGQKEYYCDKHYKELMEMFGKLFTN